MNQFFDIGAASYSLLAVNIRFSQYFFHCLAFALFWKRAKSKPGVWRVIRLNRSNPYGVRISIVFCEFNRTAIAVAVSGQWKIAFWVSKYAGWLLRKYILAWFLTDQLDSGSIVVSFSSISISFSSFSDISLLSKKTTSISLIPAPTQQSFNLNF